MPHSGEDSAGLAAQVGGVEWYHTIELPGGVLTPGYFDQRSAVAKLPLPVSLAGKRCLDIGSCDGFWAFELERRGAAEVVAVDLEDPGLGDWPDVGVPAAVRSGAKGRSRRTFGIASGALCSRVDRRDLSIYDLSPATVGTFDYVFVGSLLIHLRDPVRALQATRSVVGGELLSMDVISVPTTLASPLWPVATMATGNEPRWLTPNMAAYKLWFHKAGFEVLGRGRPFLMPFGAGFAPRPPLQERLRSPAQLLFWSLVHPFGAGFSWIRARPWPEPEPDTAQAVPRSIVGW